MPRFPSVASSVDSPVRRARLDGGGGLLGALLVVVLLLGCQSPGDTSATEDAPPVVDVTAVDYAFASPDTVRSGWTTFRMTNEGEEHHLFVLSGLPEGVTYADFHSNVAVPLDSMRTQVRTGAIDTATARNNLSRMLPDWFPQESTPMGGVSLTAPGRTASTTLKLEPGSYVMECYVRTDERRFHVLRGMAKPLVATTDSTDAAPPEADLSISLSKGQMQADSVVSAGAHTIAVHFGEKAKTDPLYLFNQHLHLARLDGETSPDTLADWMKWDPIMPAPVEFLGGLRACSPATRHTCRSTCRRVATPGCLAIRRSREQCSHSPLSDRSGALTSPLASFCTHEQTCAMPPSSPSDLFWTLLSPLVQQLEALGQVLEVCATYYAWCAGCAAGVAFLLLCGLMLSESAADRGNLLQP